MKRQTIAALIVAALVAGGWFASSQAQEQFNFEQEQSPILGDDCAIPGSPGAIASADTGARMYCDPTSKTWTLLPLETSKIVLRLRGACEAAGPDSGDICYADADCTDDAACSGAVCDCIATDPINLIELIDGVNTNATLPMAALLRFDAPDAVNAPYPGAGQAPTNIHSVFRHYTAGCPADGCIIADLRYPTATIGPATKPGGAQGITLLIQGALNADGTGSGASRLAGLYQGRVAHQADGGTNPFQSYAPKSAGGEFVGKTSWDSANDEFCIEWWDGETSAALDFRLCRGGNDELELRSPGILSGARLPLAAGAQVIPDATWAAGAGMIAAGRTAVFAAGQGVPMPRAGSIVSASLQCHFNAGGPVEQGKLRFIAQVNDVDVWTWDTPVILDADVGPHYYSSSQARGADTFAANGWIDWRIVESPQKTCEEGSNEGTIDCTSDSECTGGAACDGLTCDCVLMDVGVSGSCMTLVEVVFDD